MTDHGARRVVLVCGPPAAGKNSYVAEHASADDVVVDFDQICRDLGSADSHDHPPKIRAAARRALADRDTHVAEMTTGTAWVIRSAPNPVERGLLAHALRATEVVIVATPAATAKQRATDAGRPDWTGQAIDSWWRKYRRRRNTLERELQR